MKKAIGQLFSELLNRIYEIGNDMKQIDWKLSASSVSWKGARPQNVMNRTRVKGFLALSIGGNWPHLNWCIGHTSQVNEHNLESFQFHLFALGQEGNAPQTAVLRSGRIVHCQNCSQSHPSLSFFLCLFFFFLYSFLTLCIITHSASLFPFHLAFCQIFHSSVFTLWLNIFFFFFSSPCYFISSFLVQALFLLFFFFSQLCHIFVERKTLFSPSLSSISLFSILSFLTMLSLIAMSLLIFLICLSLCI